MDKKIIESIEIRQGDITKLEVEWKAINRRSDRHIIGRKSTEKLLCQSVASGYTKSCCNGKNEPKQFGYLSSGEGYWFL